LGFTGLADWFIENKVVYASKESIKLTEEILSVFAESAYRTSIELGKERGSFTEFNPEWYTQSEFIKRLCQNTKLKTEDFTHMRHVCLLSVAPTGTLSYVVGAGGSGCEPLPAPWLYRSERATTGEYKEHYIFNDTVINILKKNNLEVNKTNAEKLIEGEEWVFAIYDKIPNKIVNSFAKIDLMSVLYKYIDSGVSVTYNLPQTATVQDVKDIYFEAWKKGLKSVTVYRDKSREGVLNITATRGNRIIKHDAIKRPKELECNIHRLTVQGKKWVVVIGMLGEDPYEVFAGLEGNVDLTDKDGKRGKIVKTKRGDYTLVVGDESISMKTFKNEPAESALTRAHSLNLRHGVDIKFIVDQLEKSEGDMTCFSKAIARVLKKYIPDGAKVSGGECGNCNGSNLTRQSGCVTCLDCFWSKC
jgi:ribonucleoside-diphosphate reductase alpha chain